MEAFWNLFEYRHVDIGPKVIAFIIHLPGQRTPLIQNPRVASSSTPRHSSELERYFARPPQHADLDFIGYMETFHPRKTLPCSMLHRQNELLRGTGTPSYWLTERDTRHPSVARIRFVSPANVELLVLRDLFLKSSPTSFRMLNAMTGTRTVLTAQLLWQQVFTVIATNTIHLLRRP